MNNLDVIIEGNYKALARSMVFDPFDPMPEHRRLGIVERLTDAICKRSLAHKLGGIHEID